MCVRPTASGTHSSRRDHKGLATIDTPPRSPAPRLSTDPTRARRPVSAVGILFRFQSSRCCWKQSIRFWVAQLRPSLPRTNQTPSSVPSQSSRGRRTPPASGRSNGQGRHRRCDARGRAASRRWLQARGQCFGRAALRWLRARDRIRRGCRAHSRQCHHSSARARRESDATATTPLDDKRRVSQPAFAAGSR